MLHELEVKALAELLKVGGGDPTKIEELIDRRLTFSQNKRILKQWLKASGIELDVRAEYIIEKDLHQALVEARQEEIRKKEENIYKEALKRRDEVERLINEMKPDIIREISLFNPYMERVTYSTIFACMNAKHGKQRTNVINMGKHGTGKSRSTSELLELLEIPDAVIIRGFMTPKKIFETLRVNFCNIICFDEAENIFNDDMALYILRPALFGGSVSWLTTKGDIADSFEFSGTVIANMNHFSIKDNVSDPLFDRTLYNQINLSNKEIIEKMVSSRDYKMNKALWSVIRDKIMLARNDGISELSEEETEYVLNFVVRVARGATVFNKSLSTRAKSRAFLVARCLKTLFQEFESREVRALFESLTKPYVVVDDAEDICVSILREKPDITRKQLTDLIAEQKHISVRQASRIVYAAIEQGKLEVVNRSTLKIKGE